MTDPDTAIADEPLYVRDVTHPRGECPLHGTERECPCTDTGLLTARDLREMADQDGDGHA